MKSNKFGGDVMLVKAQCVRGDGKKLKRNVCLWVNLSKKKTFYHAFDPSLTLQAYLRPFDPSVVGGLH